MKTLLGLFLISFALAGSANVFAYNEWSNGGCDSGSCDVSYCNECECTDPGYGRNTCMNNAKYCEAFGNIGVR